MDLYRKIWKYAEQDYYPFHMPGHKRNSELLNRMFPEGYPSYRTDITEIEGFDNLHHAKGILKEAQAKASAVYGAKRSFFSVGGSTAGILAGISACVCRGDKILMARNCHISVYHAVELLGLEPVYLMPPCIHSSGILGSIAPEMVRAVLETEKNIKLVAVTSPTYEGILSDINSIAKAAHAYGIPLLVDEAHGAHLGFHPYFPGGSANSQADIVVQSVHKTLPSFTQTALLHINGELVRTERIEHYLSIFMTSSPSYIFMSGIDRLMGYLKAGAEEDFENYAALLKEVYRETEQLKHLHLLAPPAFGEGTEEERAGIFAKDPSKLLIAGRDCTINASGLEKYFLDSYHLVFEMASAKYLLAMTGIGDTAEGFLRLRRAMESADRCMDMGTWESITAQSSRLEWKPLLPQSDRLPSEAVRIPEKNRTHRTEAAEAVSAEYIFLYPPGVPLLVPGEIIGEGCLEMIDHYRKAGLKIQGLPDESGDYLWTC